MSDPYIAQVAKDHRDAARLHLALLVENTVYKMGLIDKFTDFRGNGPFFQELMRQEAGRR